MNIIEELEDIFSLVEDDEKFALKECIIAIKKVHKRRPDELMDTDSLQEEYEWYIEEGIPHSEWPAAVLNYEGYEVTSNVNSSGGCFPGNNMGPIPLGDPEDWGIADVYPVIEPEEEDV